MRHQCHRFLPAAKLFTVWEASYRPEIDGLRALAVLAVIMFHAKMALSGGYLGVDVFFVISGYLITSLIIKELQKGHFYLRRFLGAPNSADCSRHEPHGGSSPGSRVVSALTQ